jgi:SAM-dependent methyltransferase
MRLRGATYNMSESKSYADVLARLRAAYDPSAADRDSQSKSDWKVTERRSFLERLRDEGKTRLLELGAGSGQDSRFFQEQGLDVVTTDASPAMVAKCREKGLDAHVMDFMSLAFAPGSFDAAYALNSLLHVPNADIPAALGAIRALLEPGALLYIGVYGGDSFEGVKPDDWHDPPRFFSMRTDDELLQMVAPYFDVVDFHIVENESDGRFQSLTVRRV